MIPQFPRRLQEEGEIMRIDLKIPGGGEFHFENEPMSEERLFGVGVLIVIALFLHLFLEMMRLLS